MVEHLSDGTRVGLPQHLVGGTAAMHNHALPPVTTPPGDTPPERLITDLAALIVPGDRVTALTLAGAR